MGENIAPQEGVMVQNVLYVELFIPIEKRNLYAKSLEKLI